MAHDAVVIGSGLGGAMAALRMLEAGARVLVLERGGWPRRDRGDWDPMEILHRLRYAGPAPVHVRQRGDAEFRPMPQNETVGGMSVFYGGASLRLRASDFARWPIGYDDLEPYYTEAEHLLGVHGMAGLDPLEPPRSGLYPFRPIAASPPAERIRLAGLRVGFRPFPIPLALDFGGEHGSACIRCNTCDGFPCAISAKNDAAGILRRASRRGLEIRSGLVARRLLFDGPRVIAAECLEAASGRSLVVEGGVFVLAAGAIGSPTVLLRSDSPGLASLPVGRFLMRHCNAVVAGLFPFATNPDGVFHKQVCFTDLYEAGRKEDGLAVGVIQDIYTPAPEVVREAAGRFRGLLLGDPVVRRLQNLLCVAEDEPDPENRVRLGPDADEIGMPRTLVEHRYGPADERRLGRLTRAAGDILHEAGALATRIWPISSFSHAVGTLRMGRAAEDSVLDAGGRVRGVRNLWVTDGSAFPASGGVNPSLTIAANSLRIADRIIHGAPAPA